MGIRSLYLKGQGQLCKCGCGKRTALKRGISLRYIRGHNSSGMKLNEWIKKHGSPMRGNHLSEESKIKISVSKRKIKREEFNGYSGSLNLRQRTFFRKTIQKQVFERDNYTCQMCGIKGVVLQVDHIQSWAEYVDLRFNIDNCRTLCTDCHYKITFGKPMSHNVKTWGQNFKQIESRFNI